MTCGAAESLESAKTVAAAGAPCSACQAAKTRPNSGAYHFGCLHCCARLVISAHPSKRQASAMLAAIGRFREAPGRDAILECVRQCLAKRPSPGAKSTTP